MDNIKLLKRTLKYKAHRVKVYEDELLSPEGTKLYYDFVENRNGSGVLLVDKDEKLLFVRQYRNCIDDMDVEIPAGCAETQDFDLDAAVSSDNSKLPKNSRNSAGTRGKIYTKSDFENPNNPYYICAIREAQEETGYIPGNLIFVNYIIAAVGLFSERTAVYIGTDLQEGDMNRDDDEYIDIIKLSLDEALQWINEGKINDSKTIIAVMAYSLMKNNR